MLISATNLTKSFAEREVFTNLTFSLQKGDKVGLVGANGEGKTTLLKTLLGQEELDAGQIKKDKFLKIGYAEQNAKVTGSLWQQLISSCQEIFTLKKELLILEEQMQNPNCPEKVINQYAQLEEQYELGGGYTYEQKAKRIAFALGFPEQDFAKEAANFSGGQKTRMQLAAALLGEPDFLFLDEPTNHLDIQMIEWLEKYLQEYQGGLLIVSHDRYFLDKVVSKIFFLQDKKLKIFSGNYSAFVKQKIQQEISQLAAYEKQQDYINKTEEYIRRYKAGIKSKQARGRQSQLDRLERVEAPLRQTNFKLSLPHPADSVDKVLTINKVTIGYLQKELIKNINLVLRKGEKVALLGENGTGKTTFLRSILEDIPVLSGEIILGKRVKLGYFAQGHDGLFGSESVLDHLRSANDLGEESARTLLGSMLFRGEDVFKRLDDLSGGERARFALLKLLLEGANFLILDEPTNHLDIKSAEIVEAALANWPGSLLFVSHDRYFVDKIATRIWHLEQEEIFDFAGDYQYYQNKRGTFEKPEILVCKENKSELNPQIISAPEQRKIKKPPNLAKRLEQVELALREQDAILKYVEKRLADPAEHIDLETSKNLAEEHAALKEKIEQLLEEWEQLLELQEAD